MYHFVQQSYLHLLLVILLVSSRYRVNTHLGSQVQVHSGRCEYRDEVCVIVLGDQVQRGLAMLRGKRAHTWCKIPAVLLQKHIWFSPGWWRWGLPCPWAGSWRSWHVRSGWLGAAVWIQFRWHCLRNSALLVAAWWCRCCLPMQLRVTLCYRTVKKKEQRIYSNLL